MSRPIKRLVELDEPIRKPVVDGEHLGVNVDPPPGDGHGRVDPEAGVQVGMPRVRRQAPARITHSPLLEPSTRALRVDHHDLGTLQLPQSQNRP